MELLQVYLVPFLYVIYGFALLSKPPKPGTNWGFCTERAQKSEKAWYYAQRLSGLYCLVAGIVLFLVTGLLTLPVWLQTGLELVLIACLYPVVTALLKKEFPDD